MGIVLLCGLSQNLLFSFVVLHCSIMVKLRRYAYGGFVGLYE